jgi:hypothetical protein
MGMHESPLKQRVFDQLFNALALLFMLEDSEIEEIAKGLEDPSLSDRESEAMFKAAANAVRMAKEVD